MEEGLRDAKVSLDADYRQKVCNQKESRVFASAANAGHKKQFIQCNPDCNQM